MSVNVVNYGDTTLIDISDSTVTEETLIAGETAYAANGDKIVGTLELARVAITGSYDDLNNKPNPVLTINNISPDESGNIEVSGIGGVGQAGTGEGAEIFNDYTNNVASGLYSHAEGHYGKATGDYSHAEGYYSTASGYASHAECAGNASGRCSHAEGSGIASGDYSHAEGEGTTAASNSQHVQGKNNVPDYDGKYAHIIGGGAWYERWNIHTVDWDGNGWFSGNIKVGGASQDSTNAKTLVSSVNGVLADENGNVTVEAGDSGIGQAGTGEGAEIFNDYTDNVASGYRSHAEGTATTASGGYSHAEGSVTTASGTYSHAEGNLTTASGSCSHAEGADSKATGNGSHAEGSSSKAVGDGSHAEGGVTEALGDYSHAEGLCSKASSNYSHAQGKFNVEDTEKKYAHIVGNGADDENRSNAHTLDWDGNGWFAGNVKVGGTSQDDEAAKTLVTSVNGNVADESGNVEIAGGTGADGKSAYEVAVDNGFEGTETEWLASLKGETGESGVYTGTTEPTDENVTVWVDPSGEGINFDIYATKAYVDELFANIKRAEEGSY